MKRYGHSLGLAMGEGWQDTHGREGSRCVSSLRGYPVDESRSVRVVCLTLYSTPRTGFCTSRLSLPMSRSPSPVTVGVPPTTIGLTRLVLLTKGPVYVTLKPSSRHSNHPDLDA